jgi:uncharacterized protein (TIGR02271 family)
VSENHGDRFTELGEQYAGYAVYDRQGEKIGNVDDIFLDENDQPEYIGVKMRFQGTKSTLIPVQALRVDRQRYRIEVSVDKATAKDGPAFDNDEEITPEDEERVRAHYSGLEGRQGAAQGGGYGDYYRNEDDDTPRSAGAGGVAGEERRSGDRGLGRGPNQDRDLDRDRAGATKGGTREPRDREGVDAVAGGTGTGEPRDRGRDRDREGLGATARGAGRDEVRVQRVEEELRVGTRERETGAARIRKRVRTDREQVRVPIRREEISVDRVPVVDRDASRVEIGDDEIVVPVVEEEVVVEKRPVVKEELRIRKEVVEDKELVEEDVRREEVDVFDETTTRRGGGVEGRTDRRDTDLDDRTGGRGRGIGGRDTDVDHETQRRRTRGTDRSTGGERVENREAGGGLPIEDYDSLGVKNISERLEELSNEEVEQLRRYETANKNRSTLLARFDRYLSG